MNRLTIINKDISINTKHIDEFELELKSGTKKMKEKFHNKAIKERNAYINKEIDYGYYCIIQAYLWIICRRSL